MRGEKTQQEAQLSEFFQLKISHFILSLVEVSCCLFLRCRDTSTFHLHDKVSRKKAAVTQQQDKQK